MPPDMREEQTTHALEYATFAAPFWQRVAWVVCLQIAAASLMRQLGHGLVALNDHMSAQPPVSMDPGEWTMLLLWGPTVIPGALLGLIGHRAARWVLPLGILAFIINAIAIDVWVEVPRYLRYMGSRADVSTWPYLVEITWRHIITLYLGVVITWIVRRPTAFDCAAADEQGWVRTLLWLAVAYLISSGVVGGIVMVGAVAQSGSWIMWAQLLDDVLMAVAGICLATRRRPFPAIAVLLLTIVALIPFALQTHWAITYRGSSYGIRPVAYFIRALQAVGPLLEGAAPCVFLVWFLARREARGCIRDAIADHTRRP